MEVVILENVLGKRLRALREKANLSQKRAAKIFGITNFQLSRYESGQSNPDPDLIARFAEHYKVTTDYLHGLTDNPSPSKNSTISVAGQEIELTPEQYKVFQEMMKHPKFAIMFHDLATDTEKKVKQLIDTWEFIRKQIEQDDEEEFGEGFGELED